MKNIQEKLVVTVFGYEFQLVCSARKKGKKEENENEGDDEDLLEMKEFILKHLPKGYLGLQNNTRL